MTFFSTASWRTAYPHYSKLSGMDNLSRERRSENMRRIRSANTKPEMVVRSLAHRLGYRFRLHRRNLPGCPDLVFPSKQKAIFVHGCFWHQHGVCSDGRLPKSNTGYWSPKLANNKKRDKKNRARLAAMGWKCLVIWDC